MSSHDDNIIARGVPSVRTTWRGTGTLSAILQAIVIGVTIGLILSAAILAVRTQIDYWGWHGIFTWLGLIPALFVTYRFWRSPQEPAPEWWSRPDRVWLYGPVIWLSDLWPLLIYLWWSKVVNVLAQKFTEQPQVAIGAAFLVGGAIAGGLLIFRLASELIEPLRGNAIEPMVKQMELRFEKWKIEHGVNVDDLKRQIGALQSANAALRDQLKSETGRTRVVYKTLDRGGRERVMEVSKDYLDREDLFDWFINEAWTDEHTRDEWVALLHDERTERPTEGRKRFDDYRRILANIGAWNLDANRPLGTLAEALQATGSIPLPHPETDPAGGRAGESGTD